MRTEALETTVLEISRAREFYGYEIQKELLSKGVKVEIGRLYRVLAGMLSKGLLEARWKKSALGPRKRVYRIGRNGRRGLDRILLNAIGTVHRFYEEYMMTLPPRLNTLNSICTYLTKGLKSQATIACVSPTNITMPLKLMRTIQGEMKHAKIYLVSPGSMALGTESGGIFLMNGAYNNIPLKEGYVDLLIVEDLPRRKLVKTALKEWRRVLGLEGRLAIITPTVFAEKYKDPLTIGEFVEKHEREPSEKIEHASKQHLIPLLKNLFHRVEGREVVHMTILVASEPFH